MAEVGLPAQDMLELLLLEVPKLDPAKKHRGATAVFGSSCAKLFSKISSESFDLDAIRFLTLLNDTQGEVVISTVESIRFDGGEPADLPAEP